VTPIDTARNHAGHQIRVGDFANSMAITPDGKTLYVVNAPISPGTVQGSVTPIRVATNHALKAIPVGADPIAILITPDGATAYVCSP
jgi:YVTN family beta-propeller protein